MKERNFQAGLERMRKSATETSIYDRLTEHISAEQNRDPDVDRIKILYQALWNRGLDGPFMSRSIETIQRVVMDGLKNTSWEIEFDEEGVILTKVKAEA